MLEIALKSAAIAGIRICFSVFGLDGYERISAIR
jgi:hypothetical protein